MRGAIPPLPQSVFMAWCLVKHRGNFTFFTHRYCFTIPPVSVATYVLFKKKGQASQSVLVFSADRTTESLQLKGCV
jgi:hypothetical protein